MKTDKELLELAAKAAGIKLSNGRDVTGMHPSMNIYAAPFWNPLTNDGDALLLAVKLDMQIAVDLKGGESWVQHNQIKDLVVQEYNGSDPLAATRRAIVRAAAAIGEKL